MTKVYSLKGDRTNDQTAGQGQRSVNQSNSKHSAERVNPMKYEIWGHSSVIKTSNRVNDKKWTEIGVMGCE